MTDIVEQSRTAREKLAAALSILQAKEAGDLIDTVAEPVAKAMGALHQIETSGGSSLSESGPLARDCVRSALATLQSAPESPIADKAMEHIAGSLGLVHQLAEKALSSSAAVAPAPVAPAAVAPAPTPEAVREPTISHKAALDKTQLQADPRKAPPAGALDQTLPTPMRPVDMGEAARPISLDSTQASVSPPAPKPASVPAPSPTRHSSAPASPRRNSRMAPAPPEGIPDGALKVEANLGAHSPTNFYKGLSGNDVVDDGGLFVATYDIPKIGQVLWVDVHMPGGYEFQAVAEVRWTRESGAGDAPPGYGCAFKSVSKDARQLVYRYVRNREPLFHDDL